MPTPFDVPLYPYQRSADQDTSAPPRHPVVVIGAGPIGLALAIDLAINDVPALVLDDSDRVGDGSRAICFAKRSLEILDRLGVGEALVDKGVTWSRGKVFFGERQVYQFDLLPEDGHRRPAFINLQQYYLEAALVERLQELQRSGKPIQLRGRNRLVGLAVNADRAGHDDHVGLRIDTPDGPYALDADWLIACDGAGSAVRQLMGLDFEGRVFEDNFLIADVVMKADFPTERWFWFDPPFNRGQSALLHKQPDDVWRIDLQLGRGVDKEEEKRPENVIPRLKTMLGDDVAFELEWVSIYTFQCRRMKRFRHGPVLFAGDSAHQVSPFGARGANSGLQDADDLAWRLKLVIDRAVGDHLLDRYDIERVQAADENILNSTRSTDFITPKSPMSRVFRDAVLDLSAAHAFARPLVNSGRLSLPAIYAQAGEDALGGPARTRPGAPAVDAPLGDGWLLSRLGGRFVLLAINRAAPASLNIDGITVETVSIDAADGRNRALSSRYLGDRDGAVYLVRPDQHIWARWPAFDDTAVRGAMTAALAPAAAMEPNLSGEER
ncbi:MAG: FAD-dependent oxidoreductase [Geminicoccaceae bacterium]